jgi:CO/xanthine dehydrogenase Mo-binding subunit
MGAAPANAIYDAAGARLLQLPITPDRIRAAVSRT